MQKIFRKVRYNLIWRVSQGAIKKAEEMGSAFYLIYQEGHGRICERATGIECHKSEFSPKAQKFIGEHAKKRNLELLKLKIKLEEAIIDYEQNGSIILLQKTIQRVDEKIELIPRKFLEVTDEYLEVQSTKIRPENHPKHMGNIEFSTYRTYRIRRDNVLIPFLNLNKLQGITIDKIDGRFLEKFDIWITSFPTEQGKSRGQQYATKCVKFIKQVVNFAVFSGYVKANLANAYRTKKETIKQVETLEPEDIALIESYVCTTEKEQKVLDMFLFCHETFLHYGDLVELKESHIITDKEGQKWIIKTRKKSPDANRQIIRMPLSDKALSIIEKYKSVEKLPKISNGECSIFIKKIAAKAGVESHIKFKMARSSGISKAYNEKNMEAEKIAILSGWETPRELKSYLKIDLFKLKNQFLTPQTTQNATNYQV
jgi:integrase